MEYCVKCDTEIYDEVFHHVNVGGPLCLACYEGIEHSRLLPVPEDRRTHPRTLLPIQPRVLFSYAWTKDAGGGHVLNISPGGTLISTDEAAFAWMDKQIVLHLPRLGVLAGGRVVRYEPGRSIAVMFEDISTPQALARLCGGGA